jgi:hypothetical protein
VTIWKCPVCKLGPFAIDFFPVHCACGYVQMQPKRGAGDWLAVALAMVGITERRYARAKRRIGLRGKCGCKKRQQRLNTFGAQLKSLALWCLGK